MKTMSRARLTAAAAFVLVALLVAGCGQKAAEADQYHCPIHPTYISNAPGDCPICGMRLVPIGEKAPATRAPAYTCQMHPEVTSTRGSGGLSR